MRLTGTIIRGESPEKNRIRVVRALLLVSTLASASSGVLAQSTEPVIVGEKEPSEARGDQSAAVAPRFLSRSHELLDFDCRNSLGREQLTLFGNGTVRLRSGLGQEGIDFWLKELRPEELVSYRNRLVEIDLSETVDRTRSVGGEWIEQCELDLDLPGRPPRDFSFSRNDSLTLALRRIVNIANEIIGLIDRTDPPQGAQQLPLDYEVEVGDYLKREDGAVFRVIAFTGDEQGLELQGRDQPLTIYMPVAELRRHFIARVDR